MDAAKKEIRAACKKAKSYQAWRNPFKVWFVTLYDKDETAFLEFQYSDDFPLRERTWIENLLNEIDNRNNINARIN